MEGGTNGAAMPTNKPLTWSPSPELREGMKPFLDLDHVGARGLEIWLLAVLPTLPCPRASEGTVPRAVQDPDTRVFQLARALAECDGQRSRDHFLAAEYYVDNTRLARRVRALEAEIRTAQKAGRVPNLVAEEGDPARPERYLPRGASP
jgi:hypothetical protein